MTTHGAFPGIHPTPAADLTAQAVPLPEKNTLRIDVADIPLPPAELVDELDNSTPAPASEKPAEAPEIATLDFVGEDLPFRDFPLRFLFRFRGAVVGTVRVSQLTTAEVGQISAEWSRTDRAPDYFDLYARMTGLPAPVLRALPAIDGEPIVAAAYDFLPPWFRGGAA